jgi:uncharacterized protein YllA (UPF0747 family)
MQVLPYPQLPGMNSLFLDYVEDSDRVRNFYPPKDFIRSPRIDHRKELCRILQKQNESVGNAHTRSLIEKLSQSDTHCVVTGQQVGLLTGPTYTMWKALSALRFAHEMESQKGLNCVPIFWMATEDHNWHEIMHFSLLRDDYELIPFSLKEHLFLKRQPTGAVLTTNEEVRKILLRAFREIELPEVKSFYSSGTLAQAFARTLLWLLKDQQILVLDPSDPDLKKLANPFFEKIFKEKTGLMDSLKKQNKILEDLNYPVQVKMEEGQFPLFRLEGSERIHVRIEEASDKLLVKNLSPSALLRPLFQDYLLPTLAYFGGPAEIAYFAQLHPWYAMMGIEQPAVLPRASLSLIPARITKFLNSKELKPEELFLKEEVLMDALIKSRDWDEIRPQVKSLKESIHQHLNQIKQNAGMIDVTLKKSIETAAKKLNYQVQKLERKTFLALGRKNQTLAEQIRKAKNVLYPEDRLQERSLNIFSFSSRLPYLISEVYDKMDLTAKGHQWLKI